MDDKAVWEALGEAALLQGNHQIVEMAYQRTKDFERLSFLYLVTGNLEKLQKMMKIAQIRKDLNGQFQTALFLGDVEERIKGNHFFIIKNRTRKENKRLKNELVLNFSIILFLVLKDVGQPSLAYLTAATHGYAEEAEKLKADLEARGQPIPSVEPNAQLLVPPPPIQQMDENWPLLTVTRGVFDAQLLGGTKTPAVTASKAARAAAAFAVEEGDETSAGDAWGVDGDLMVDEEGNLEIDEGEALGEGAAGEEDGWDVGDEVALPADVDVGKGGDETDFFSVPAHGQPPSTHWANNSRLVFDHVTAGAFDSAARLLTDQLGVISLEPFRQLFLSTYARYTFWYLYSFPEGKLV